MKVYKLISVLLVIILVSFTVIGCGERNEDYEDIVIDNNDDLPFLPSGAVTNWNTKSQMWQNSNTTRDITVVADEDSGKNVMKMVWYTVYRDDNQEPGDVFGLFTITANLADSGLYHEYDGFIYDYKTGPNSDFNIPIEMVNSSNMYKSYVIKNGEIGWISDPVLDWVTVFIPWSNFVQTEWSDAADYNGTTKDWLKNTNGKKIELSLGGDPRAVEESETTYFRHIGCYIADPDTGEPVKSRAIWFPK